MERESGVSQRDPWPWIGWSSVGGLVVVSVVLGFVVLPRYQQNAPTTFDIWNAILPKIEDHLQRALKLAAASNGGNASN